MLNAMAARDRVYCVGCISFDCTIVLPAGTARCPVCDNSDLMSEADHEALVSRLMGVVEAQLPGSRARPGKLDR